MSNLIDELIRHFDAGEMPEVMELLEKFDKEVEKIIED